MRYGIVLFTSEAEVVAYLDRLAGKLGLRETV